MLGTAIIVFREVLEAALIVGLVLAATRGVAGRVRWIGIGIGGGILGAVLLAMAADSITSMAEGMGQELMNAGILFLAVGMLTWHLLWMKKHAIQISRDMQRIGSEVSSGSKEPVVLALIVGLAILREGSEAVIFLYGLAVAGSSPSELTLGTGLGVLGGVTAGTILYLGIARIPTGRLFQVSGWLILLLTAGLASQGASYLVQADVLPALSYTLWDSSWLLSQQSIPGEVLHILVGYVDRPMGIQVLVYLLTAGLIGLAMSLMGRADLRSRQAATSH
jgi:high-affinity iron transporter